MQGKLVDIQMLSTTLSCSFEWVEFVHMYSSGILGVAYWYIYTVVRQLIGGDRTNKRAARCSLFPLAFREFLGQQLQCVSASVSQYEVAITYAT